jgi:acyl-coenzyme A thioesterase PaaI-like protein
VTTVEIFQDQFEHNLCFGCGAANKDGLQLKSHWSGDDAVATFVPQPHHMAGPAHVLNGGIIGTIVDCHCVCTAIADAYRREGRPVGSGDYIWYATVSLRVDYLRPTPIDQPVNLIAHVSQVSAKKTVLSCTISSNGHDCARAEVIAVRVPKEWLSKPAP